MSGMAVEVVVTQIQCVMFRIAVKFVVTQVVQCVMVSMIYEGRGHTQLVQCVMVSMTYEDIIHGNNPVQSVMASMTYDNVNTQVI